VQLRIQNDINPENAEKESSFEAVGSWLDIMEYS